MADSAYSDGGGAAGWPGARPYDVVFYRSHGTKAGINLVSQHVWDPRTLGQGGRFTHCALVGSELTAIEAYPRSVKGAFTGMVHPGGVRFVPVADLCIRSDLRYRGFTVLRNPFACEDVAASSVEAMGFAWSFLRHRYGLRRFLGLRQTRLPGEPVAERGTQWMSCADIVHDVLKASGRFGLPARAAVGPMTLHADLVRIGWRDVTAAYAPARFASKAARYAETDGREGAALDVFAVRVGWVLGTLATALRERQYRLETLINARLARPEPGGGLDEAIALLDGMRSSLPLGPAASADSLMTGLIHRRGLLK